MSSWPEQRSPTWRELPPAAKAFRMAHAGWAVVSLTALGYVWLAAITRRRDRILAASVGWLGIEGTALVLGRGNCPFGPFQARLDDPVPLFELVLPPRGWYGDPGRAPSVHTIRSPRAVGGYSRRGGACVNQRRNACLQSTRFLPSRLGSAAAS